MTMNGRVAIITGSSRGLGKEIALCLAQAGASVVVNYRNTAQCAEEVVECIKKMGRQAFSFKADVYKYKEVERMVALTLKEFGRVDILINNAAINRDANLNNLIKGAWQDVIATNLTGVYNCTKAVIGPMCQGQFGRIINIASVTGQIGAAGASNYSASKGGVISFTKAIAREVAKKGITVNAISPGYFDIGMGQRLTTKLKENLLIQIPMGRFGRPEELTGIITYLASDEAGYITGQIIDINGGLYI